MRVNTALLGNRRYQGAGLAPNRGQVSAQGAQGYIRRELRNKQGIANQRQMGAGPVGNPKGRDGQSDNRSAVAAQALQRRQQPKFQNEGRTKKFGPQKPKFQNEGRTHNVRGGAPVGSGGGAPVQQVKVNANGLLELPYNQEFSEANYGALQEANDALLGLKMEGDQQALQYSQSKRDMGLQYDTLKGQTLNQNAARGTAFSSAYGLGVSNNATNFANQMGDLEAKNTSFAQNQAMQRAAIQSALNQQLGLGAQAYANQLGSQAGTLGFGQHTAKPSKPPSVTRGPKKKPGKPKAGKPGKGGASVGNKKPVRPKFKNEGRKHPVGTRGSRIQRGAQFALNRQAG